MKFDVGYAIEILPILLEALVVTIEAAVLGMALALVVGLVWALLRRSDLVLVRWPAKVTLELVRSTPLLVQLYFLFYALPAAGLSLSPLTAGVLGLGVHYGAYVAEAYRAGIEAVPKGQWEAAKALHLPRHTTWLRVVLPQAVPPMLPTLGNRFVALFKDTPLLSAITLVEMLQAAKIIGSESFRYLEPMTLVGLLFLALSIVASYGVERLERRVGSLA